MPKILCSQIDGPYKLHGDLIWAGDRGCGMGLIIADHDPAKVFILPISPHLTLQKLITHHILSKHMQR